MNSSQKPVETIRLGELEVEIVRSHRRKRLSIEVGHNGVKARAPATMRYSTVLKFVNTKRQWIIKSWKNLPPKIEPMRLENGGEVRILGEPYTLQVLNGRGKIRIEQDSQLLVPITKSHLPIEESVKRKLHRWFKGIAMQHLELRVRNRLTAMFPNKSISTIKVRDYKRRWGSCDHKGELSFNWRIVMAPEEVLDYVIIHEIAHLKEFNHSKRFWNLVEQQMPDWKDQHNWLNQYGAELYQF